MNEIWHVHETVTSKLLAIMIQNFLWRCSIDYFVKRIIALPGRATGVCASHSYGTRFGVVGRMAAGETYSSCSALWRACEVLLEKQERGGWGEAIRTRSVAP